MSDSQPHDFAADALEILKRRKVTLHGCAPDFIEIFLDGSIKIWFMGLRDGKPWRGGLTIMDADPVEQAIYFGRPEIIAELCEKMIDHSNSRFY